MVVVSALTTAAWADPAPTAPPAGEGPASSEPATPAVPAAMAAPHKFAGEKTVFYMSGNVSDSPFFTVGTTFAPGVSIAIGGSYKYDGNGIANAAGMATTTKSQFEGLIYGAYYFYNKFPVGIAAEAAVISNLTGPGDALDVITIQPGVVMYYAPFPVPLVIGTALDVQINMFRGDLSALKPQVATVTPGLRLIYVFP
jgi:hypothetical protein